MVLFVGDSREIHSPCIGDLDETEAACFRPGHLLAMPQPGVTNVGNAEPKFKTVSRTLEMYQPLVGDAFRKFVNANNSIGSRSRPVSLTAACALAL